MDGIHDLGGMHGFGPVPAEVGGTFHDDWERTVFAIHMLVRNQGVYNLHEFRHARERMTPADYLTASYFEQWLAGVETLLHEKGVVTEEELSSRIHAFDGSVAVREDPDMKRRAREIFESDRFETIDQRDPRFESGDEVTVKTIHPEGHTRIPRYTRGATGVVRKVYGSFHLPDAVAHGRDDTEPCYSVTFAASELWGDNTEASVIHIDMFENYIGPA